MMWGSNVPVTRTPDAHWMAEVRYRGTKVVVVSPDYADNTKFADEWLPAQAGTDAALAMAMGHVILTRVLRPAPHAFFDDYVDSSPICRSWSRLDRSRRVRTGPRQVPHRRRPARRRRRPPAPPGKTVVLDTATEGRRCRTAPSVSGRPSPA